MFINKEINIETELVITEVWSNIWKITVVTYICISVGKKSDRNGRIFGKLIDKKIY